MPVVDLIYSEAKGYMHISFFTSESGYNATVGYGQAGKGIISSLQSLGHFVTLTNPKADIHLNFVQPVYYEYIRSDIHTIGYTPWESTELPMYWLENFNKCDEVWATSPIVAQWYLDAGVKKPVRVYEHGLHDIWKSPRVREVKNKFRFLHIGEPAERKGGSLTVKAFIELFGDNPDVELTIKAHEANTIRHKDMFGNFIDIAQRYPNIKIVSREMEDEELLQLMSMHHCLVYPSWGEGFGFIPLQAMATAMPTICTESWAPYKEFITLKLDSTLGDSPWPMMHPGKMYEPNIENLKELMMDAINSYSKHSAIALKNTTKIYEKYNWIDLTKKAFEHLV